MLTRHFYELEEVAYALIDCLRKRRSEEAVFWAREMLLSEEEEMLTITVVQAWIMFMGPPGVDWLDAWFSSGSSNKLTLIQSFCQRSTASRGWLTFWIAARGFSPVPSDERVSSALTDNDPICLYWWLGQQYEKKPSTVLATLSTFVDSPEIFDSIKKAFTLKVGLHMKVLLSVCAVQILCLKSYPESCSCSDSSLTWSVGLRASRLFTIRDEQLPRGYKRVTQTEGLCMSPMELFKRGCTFWQHRFAEASTSDEMLDSIVNEYFPNDIPDEWSVADRSKSHPVSTDVYKVMMSPEYIIKLVWSPRFGPVIRKAWRPQILQLFKACRVPNR
jgi:hypothetical protein